MEDALAVSNLRCYQCSLKGLAANTVRAAFHPLRGLSEFLIHEAKLLEENPVKAFTMPKKAEGRRLTMSDPEALALLDAAARQCDPRKVAMSVALISALLYTGVRADELVNIRLADVLFDQEEMLVSKGKGGAARAKRNGVRTRLPARSGRGRRRKSRPPVPRSVSGAAAVVSGRRPSSPAGL